MKNLRSAHFSSCLIINSKKCRTATLIPKLPWYPFPPLLWVVVTSCCWPPSDFLRSSTFLEKIRKQTPPAKDIEHCWWPADHSDWITHTYTCPRGRHSHAIAFPKVCNGQCWLCCCRQERCPLWCSSSADPLVTHLNLADVQIHAGNYGFACKSLPLLSLFCVCGPHLICAAW